MASYLSEARTRLAVHATSAFGLASGTLFSVEVAERVDWRGLMAAKERDASASGITPPYGVLVFGPAVPSDGPLTRDCHTMEVHGIFCASTRNTDGTAKDPFTLRTNIEDALLALKTAVYADSSGYIQCWEYTPDLDQANPANRYYMEFNLPMYAGIVRMNIFTSAAF